MPLEGFVNARVVFCGEQVEEQAANDRQTQSRLSSIVRLRESLGPQHGQGEFEPGVDHADQERRGIGTSLQRLPVELEEEPLEGCELRRYVQMEALGLKKRCEGS
jgi:hypothetical protein